MAIFNCSDTDTLALHVMETEVVSIHVILINNVHSVRIMYHAIWKAQRLRASAVVKTHFVLLCSNASEQL